MWGCFRIEFVSCSVQTKKRSDYEALLHVLNNRKTDWFSLLHILYNRKTDWGSLEERLFSSSYYHIMKKYTDTQKVIKDSVLVFCIDYNSVFKFRNSERIQISRNSKRLQEKIGTAPWVLYCNEKPGIRNSPAQKMSNVKWRINLKMRKRGLINKNHK